MDESPITAALGRLDRGDPGASEELWDLVYADLKRIALGRIQSLRSGETLQATALVHEAWMKMGKEDSPSWSGRAHFFAVASLCMRNVLVDDARRKHAVRRGGGVRPGELSDTVAEGCAGTDTDPTELLALDEALTALAERYERPSEVVMLRFFGGRTIAETAELLDVSPGTIDREFLFARTWLRRFMERGKPA
ncbi:MAG: ECF-type sigma factor [Planctomycetota bacterium]